MKFEQKHIQCDLRFVAYGSGKKFGKKKKKFKRMNPPQMNHGISVITYKYVKYNNVREFRRAF